LEVAFEEGAGVLEVLFGVGFGGGNALKRFVQQADDTLLFGQRLGVIDFNRLEVRSGNLRLSCACNGFGNIDSAPEQIL
jgi:hypothetical protein